MTTTATATARTMKAIIAELETAANAGEEWAQYRLDILDQLLEASNSRRISMVQAMLIEDGLSSDIKFDGGKPAEVAASVFKKALMSNSSQLIQNGYMSSAQAYVLAKHIVDSKQTMLAFGIK